jgi:hypothetical protein
VRRAEDVEIPLARRIAAGANNVAAMVAFTLGLAQ